MGFHANRGTLVPYGDLPILVDDRFPPQKLMYGSALEKEPTSDAVGMMLAGLGYVAEDEDIDVVLTVAYDRAPRRSDPDHERRSSRRVILAPGP